MIKAPKDTGLELLTGSGKITKKKKNRRKYKGRIVSKYLRKNKKKKKTKKTKTRRGIRMTFSQQFNQYKVSGLQVNISLISIFKSRNNYYSQIHLPLQQTPAHSNLELCL